MERIILGPSSQRMMLVEEAFVQPLNCVEARTTVWTYLTANKPYDCGPPGPAIYILRVRHLCLNQQEFLPSLNYFTLLHSFFYCFF